ncbi:MAG: ferredoxin--NADP reductase [Galactobacter sp.]
MTGLGQALRRIPMYVVVAGALVLLALWSLLGATLRTIPQYNGDLSAALLVSVVATLAANTVVSAIIRAPLRFSSALTTGLLIYFIMWPTATADDLISVALAAVIAVVGKFLLVPFGRRLVNPAAFGALAVVVLGLGTPSWWVATSWMLWAVLALGLVVLWRAGSWDAALACFLVYLVLNVQWLMSTNSSSLLSTMRTALVSYPMVFLCLFMVTEPLSGAPSRWQRVVVGAVTGLIASRPINVAVGDSGFTLGPEFALVAGNLVAAVLAFVAAAVDGRATGAGGKLTVTNVERLAPSLVEVEFFSKRARKYLPGQALELTVPGGGGTRGNRRVLSLVGTDPQKLRVIYRLPAKASQFKLRLAAAQPGFKVRSEGIRGDFSLGNGNEPVVLVARGVGITPFLSQIEAVVRSEGTRDVVLIHVVSSPGDEVLTSRLAARLGSENLVSTGVKLIQVDSEASLVIPELLRICPDVQQRRALVSGSPGFVARAKSALQDAGVAKVKTDSFAGY